MNSSQIVLPIIVAPACRMRATAAAVEVAGACAASQSGLPPPVRYPAISYMSLTAALRAASGPAPAPPSGAVKSWGTNAESDRAADMPPPILIRAGVAERDTNRESGNRPKRPRHLDRESLRRCAGHTGSDAARRKDRGGRRSP